MIGAVDDNSSARVARNDVSGIVGRCPSSVLCDLARKFIAHGQRDVFIIQLKRDPGLIGRCMFSNVGQRFLDDAQEL